MDTVSKHVKVKNTRQKLKLFRANEPLKSVLMWGINYSYSNLKHINPRAVLLKDDFKSSTKVKVSNHLFNKENMESRFKYKEYCPLVFKFLRGKFRVSEIDYWDSFTKSQPCWDGECEKSGSRLLVTYNRQFVAKTISSEEVEQLHHFLKVYHDHVVKAGGQTLLSQYVGLYRLTVNDQETYILAMKTVFSPRLRIHQKIDLKNPAIDREVNDKEKLKGLKEGETGANEVDKIYIGEESKKRLLSVLESDIQLLQENNLIDYSLLIGFHYVEAGQNDWMTSCSLESSRIFDEKTVSAGDGLGTLASQWQCDQNHVSRSSIGIGGITTTNTTVENLSSGDDYEEDGDGVNQQGNSSANATPPDSPPGISGVCQPFTGELHTSLECYGIKSSDGAPKFVYFVAIVDTLTRYGMRKRTTQSHKMGKHGLEPLKPEQYGRRLLECADQYFE